MSNKRKIAFVIGSLTSGGAERVVSTLSNALTYHYDVTIITLKKSRPFYETENSIKIVSCLDEIKPSKTVFDSISLNFRLTKKLIKVLKDNKIELVIGFITMSNILTIFASKYLKIPCIISERNNPYNDATPKFWKISRRLTYPLSNALVVQTNMIKEFYLGRILEKKIFILPNPISPELTIGRDKNVPKEDIILNVAKLHPQKNQEMLIRAFKNLKHEGWKLLIIGEGEKREDLEVLINELGLENKIQLLGRKDNIHEYYNKAKIFAFTSNYEGFPNALLEAMHFGIASISTNCKTGPSELIVDGETGFLVETNNQMEFQNKLQILIDHPEIRERFSRKSTEITTQYKSANVCEQWKGLIENNFL